MAVKGKRHHSLVFFLKLLISLALIFSGIGCARHGIDTVRFSCDDCANLYLYVADENGKAVPDVSLEIKTNDNRKERFKTGKNGVFLASFPKKWFPFSIKISAEGYQETTVNEICPNYPDDRTPQVINIKRVK